MNLKIWRSRCQHLNLSYGKVSLVANLSSHFVFYSPPSPQGIRQRACKSGDIRLFKQITLFSGNAMNVIPYVCYSVREIEKFYESGRCFFVITSILHSKKPTESQILFTGTCFWAIARNQVLHGWSHDIS